MIESVELSDVVCPECGVDCSKKESFRVNRHLLKEITESLDNHKEKNLEKLCKLHQQENELFCLDCEKMGCSYCFLFTNHKEHRYEKIYATKNRLEGIAQGFIQKMERVCDMTTSSDLIADLNTVKRDKIAEVNSKFNYLKIALQRCRLNSLSKVAGFYDNLIAEVQEKRKKAKKMIKLFKEDKTLYDNPEYFFKVKKSYTKQSDEIKDFFQFNLKNGKKGMTKLLSFVFDEKLLSKIENCFTITNKEFEEQAKEREKAPDAEENLLSDVFD